MKPLIGQEQPILWCSEQVLDAHEAQAWVATLIHARRERQLPPEPSIEHARLLERELRAADFDIAARQDDWLVLDSQLALQCCEVGVLLWLTQGSSDTVVLAEAYLLAQKLALRQRFATIQLIEVSSDDDIDLSAFSAMSWQQHAERRTLQSLQAARYDTDRRWHIAIVVSLFLISVLITWLFTDQEPWRAFLMAVIYTPLLIAAVLTVLYVAQRLRRLARRT